MHSYYFQVLKTLPWEILDIEVVLVETDHLGEVFPGSRHQLHTFFDKHGYEYVATICKKQIRIFQILDNLQHFRRG